MGRPIGPGALTRRSGRIHLRIEILEDRSTPAGVVIGGDIFYPTVVAGDPIGIPDDSPDKRIDPNTKSSPYAGVGSIQVTSARGSYIGTGTPIGRRHVLTAAHVLDVNNDGKVNSSDRTSGTYFILNFGGNRTSRIAITRIKIHPDYNGFGNSINDDIAILTLGRDLPAGVPIYDLPTGEITQGMVLTFVGYGRSGDGINGYNTPASFTVKRVGENVADAFYGQDDPGRPEANEVFRFDFDGPNGNGPLGGETLGNDRETTLGAGDSGGPAFAGGEGGVMLMGMGTFVQGSDAPKFGSTGGGVNLFWFTDFINSVLHPGTGGGTPLPVPPSSGSGEGGFPNHDAVPVRFASMSPLSWSAGALTSPAGAPSVAEPGDDRQGDPILPVARDESESDAPMAGLTSPPDIPVAPGLLLSVDSGLLECVAIGSPDVVLD
jgi:Trypsin